MEELKATLTDIVTRLGQLEVGQQQATTAAQNVQQAAAAAQQAAAPRAPPAPPKKPLPGQLTEFSLLPGEDFRVWLARFESAAEANDWADLAKIKQLPTFLRGQAEKMFYMIPDGERSNFRWSVPLDPVAAAAVPALAAPLPGNAQNVRNGAGLRQKLLDLFCSDVQKSLAATTLRARVQAENESAAAFLLDIESLAKAAYENFEQIRDGFIKDLALQNMNASIRFVISLNPPDTWDALKKQAEIVEASLHSLIGTPVKKPSSDLKVVNQFENLEFSQAVHSFQSGGQRGRGFEPRGRQNFLQDRGGRGGPWRPRGSCYNCGNFGHYAHSCQYQPRGYYGTPGSQYPPTVTSSRDFHVGLIVE